MTLTVRRQPVKHRKIAPIPKHQLKNRKKKLKPVKLQPKAKLKVFL